MIMINNDNDNDIDIKMFDNNHNDHATDEGQ